MTLGRLKIGLLICVVGLLPSAAHGQFNSGGFGGGFDSPTKPPVIQTPAQMARDFRALGFVVPQKMDYRNVEVVLGDDESGSPPFFVRTRGWILPGKKDEPRSFVAWNGWVYRARSVGQKADWRADARALVERAARDYPQLRPSKGFGSPVGPATWTYEGLTSDDTVSLSFDALTPLKAVMLQLLGEEQLAKQAFLILKTAQKKRNVWRSINPKDLSPDPLVRFEFVGDWVWPGMNRVDRAITTGNDVTALETLRVLVRGLDTTVIDSSLQSNLIVHQLLRDWTRRQTDVAPADHNSVAFVIWDLQNVGLVDPVPPAFGKENARFQRAVDYGDQMVEPLLDVLEHDRRLTRGRWSQGKISSVGNDSKRDYPPVSDIALRALQDILQVDYNDQLWRIVGELQQIPKRADSPKTYDETMSDATSQLAAIIRADWKKWRVVPASERPYVILKDDTSGSARWHNAARALLRPKENDTHYYRDSVVESPFRFETLRAKTNPSVSELLARRSNQLALEDRSAEDEWPRNFYAQERSKNLSRAVDLALVLHFWDEPAGRPVVLARMRDSGMSLQLLDAAPQEGREFYANYLRGLKRDKNSTGSADAFRPLWRNLDDPFWQQVAKDIFADPASPWNHVLSLPQPFHDLDDVFRAPLLALPEWNAVVRRDLKDETPLGQVKWNEREIVFSIEGTPGRKHALSPDSNLTPLQGEAPFRVCDLVANALYSQLQRRAGAPPFSITAPVATRDAQIQTIIAWVALQSGNSAFLKRF